MDRRNALQALAAAVSAPRFIAWDADALMDGLRPHLAAGHAHQAPQSLKRATYRFQTLDAHQRATVAELTEMIIPATDTPGARAAKVDEFIDIILSEWATDKDRADFLAGLADLDARSTAASGRTFLDATPAQRTALLTVLDAELTAARTRRKAWKRGDGPPPPDHRALFFHQVRSLTVSGYYASEVGYTKERRELLVPGRYSGGMLIGDR